MSIPSTVPRSRVSVRIALWDICRGGTRKLELLDRLKADVLLLLAVSPTSADRYRLHWADRYDCAAALDLVSSAQSRPVGAMIASRWPMEEAWTIDALPRPERALFATVNVGGNRVTLGAWGTPNAAGEGYPAKMDAYRLMTDYLADREGSTIVGVDTNSRFDPPDPEVDIEHDELRKDEHRFLARDAVHGLADVHRALVDADPDRWRLVRDLRPHGPLATTFVRRPHGRPRGIARGFDSGRHFGLDRMDRIFVSSDIRPLACEHLYHESLDLGGDHAAVIADLAFHGQVRRVSREADRGR